jgi:hypothetical protein
VARGGEGREDRRRVVRGGGADVGRGGERQGEGVKGRSRGGSKKTARGGEKQGRREGGPEDHTLTSLILALISSRN